MSAPRFSDVSYGPGTFEGIRPVPIHNGDVRRARYNYLIERRRQNSMIRVRPKYRKGRDNTGRNLGIPENSNGFLRMDAARNVDRARKDFYNKPIVQADFKSTLRQIPLKYKTWEGYRRPPPRKTIEDMYGIKYDKRNKNVTGYNMPEQYILDTLRVGPDMFIRNFDNKYARNCQKTHGAKLKTPAEQTALNCRCTANVTTRDYLTRRATDPADKVKKSVPHIKIMTDKEQLRPMHGKYRANKAKNMTLSEEMRTRFLDVPNLHALEPASKIPYKINCSARVRRGKQYGSAPTQPLPGTKPYVRAAKIHDFPLKKQLDCLPGQLDKHVGISAIYRARFGDRKD